MALMPMERVTETARTFLRAELRVAHSFADLASRSIHADQKRSDRQRKQSRRAYDVVERLLPQIRLLPQSEAQEIKAELGNLKATLSKLGEEF